MNNRSRYLRAGSGFAPFRAGNFGTNPARSGL